MEKQKLIDSLKEFTDNQELSVDLYFAFKNGDYYTHYISDPNPKLREKLIQEFIYVLSKFSDENNPYELKNIYDDNEYEDYHLFYDSIDNNEIARQLLQIDRANTDPYTPEAGSLSKIYGFLIEISNGENFITIYKRNQPTNAVNPQNVINFFTGANNKLALLNQNAIYLTKQIDLFKLGDTILINSRSVYEHQFGFEAELKSKAETGFIDLLGTGAFSFNEDLQEKVKKFPKSELKKLSNLTKNNPIIEKQNWQSIIRQGKRYAKHDFEKDENGLIIINSQKELKVLISILNRDFNVNDASKEKFLTKNKKLIR